MAVNIKEEISKKISQLMIENYSKLDIPIDQGIMSQQKTVKNGIITVGREQGDRMWVYASEYQANPNATFIKTLKEKYFKNFW